MLKIVLSFFLLLIIGFAYPQTGYHIKLTLRPYTRQQVYLGYYYGKIKAVADSAILDMNSSCIFTGKEKLPPGIYFIVSPKKELLFEVLIDRDQDFSIDADTADLSKNIRFTNSPDNDLFQAYTPFVAKKGKQIADAQALLAKAKTKQDSTALIEELKKTNSEIQDYRSDIIKKYPNSILTTLLNALKEPIVPTAENQPGKGHDSLFAYHYYKAHFWDSVSFTDDRLVRTPILEPKLEKYFRDLVAPQPDSINQEVDWMLLYSRTNKEMFKFLLVHFVQKYINPEYMGQDAVFVHLFEKFINTGQAEFFTEKYRKFVNDRAYSLMANLIGQPAPNLEMVDSLNKPRPLYGVDAKFIVICFWDPTCSHCKELVPRLDSIYEAKWKKEGVKIYGVMVDGGKETWSKYIIDHNLKDWIHVYETREQHDSVANNNLPGYKQLYDVYQTPTLFLLDKDKRIIAKKLTYQQFDEVIDLKLKNAKTN
jgi:thiol-disulfide isomerase/thioredoxin